jgi:hypothetical protein
MTGMIYRLITTSAVLCLAASTFTTSVAVAQTHAGQPESVVDPVKIYSPYGTSSARPWIRISLRVSTGATRICIHRTRPTPA